MIRMIEKEVIDKYYDILEKHNNRVWATDELEWLININYFNFICEDDFNRACKIITILRNSEK